MFIFSFRLGQPAQAVVLLQEAQTIMERILGPEHQDVATIINNLAAAYQVFGWGVAQSNELQNTFHIKR